MLGPAKSMHHTPLTTCPPSLRPVTTLPSAAFRPPLGQSCTRTPTRSAFGWSGLWLGEEGSAEDGTQHLVNRGMKLVKGAKGEDQATFSTGEGQPGGEARRMSHPRPDCIIRVRGWPDTPDWNIRGSARTMIDESRPIRTGTSRAEQSSKQVAGCPGLLDHLWQNASGHKRTTLRTGACGADQEAGAINAPTPGQDHPGVSPRTDAAGAHHRTHQGRKNTSRRN